MCTLKNPVARPALFTIYTTITTARRTAHGNVGIVRSEPHFFHSPNHHKICEHSATSKQET